MHFSARVVTFIPCALLASVLTVHSAPLKLREAVDAVSVSTTSPGSEHPLAAGTALDGACLVQTGPSARADLELGQGALRLGAQTTLHVSEHPGELCLGQGTALFDALPKERIFMIRFGDEPVTIEGGTGFAVFALKKENKPATLHIGAIAGRITVTRAGKSLVLAPAQILSLTEDDHAQVGNFNLARQVESSELVNGFQTSLPGIKRVRQEAKRFASLQRRGFVQIQNLPANPTDNDRPGTVRPPNSQDSFAAAISQGSDPSAGFVQPIGIGQASGRGQLASLADAVGFQNRQAVIARGGNGALGNGEVPPPGWLNPNNPHFGNPQNDGTGSGQGHGRH